MPSAESEEIPNPVPVTVDPTSLCAAWGIAGDLLLLSNSQNAVYAATLEHQPVIVRVTNAQHRSRDMITAELDWVAYLAAQGINVSLPLPSQAGNRIESFESDGDTFRVVLFPKAQGKQINEVGEIDAPLAFRWGALIGRMNRLSHDFRPGAHRRKNAEDEGMYSLSWHAKQLASPRKALLETLEWMDAQQKNADNYGLIHGDMGYQNFFYDDPEIYPFDFDDCCYHWRLYDLAVPLYSIYFDLTINAQSLEPYHFIKERITAGFLSEYPTLEPHINDLDRFIQYRIALLYCWCHNDNHTPHWMKVAGSDWRRTLKQWANERLAKRL